jgi:hypothetical protein
VGRCGGVKMGRAARRRPWCRWPLEAVAESGAGARSQGRALLPGARRSAFRYPNPASGSPPGTRDGSRTVGASRPAGPGRGAPGRSWASSPRSRSPRRRDGLSPGAACHHGGPAPHQGLAGPSTTKQILELAEQLAGEDPGGGGGVHSEDWRPLVFVLEARGWWCGWSMPVTSSTCRGRPRPTSWMRCGCATGPDRHLGGQIDQLTARIEQTITAIAAAPAPSTSNQPRRRAAATSTLGWRRPRQCLITQQRRRRPQTGQLLAAPCR